MKKLTLLITALAITLTSCLKDLDDEGIASTTLLKGRVVEESEMLPVSGVRVSVTNGHRSYATETTGEDGRFEISVDFKKIDENYYLFLDGGNAEKTDTLQLLGMGQEEYDYKNIILYNKEVTDFLQVTTAEISSITANTAVCEGTVTAGTSVQVTAKGVCWSKSPTPTIDQDHTNEGEGLGTFTSTMTNLDEQCVYYVRAYAQSEDAVAYGEQQIFTTAGAIPTFQYAGTVYYVHTDVGEMAWQSAVSYCENLSFDGYNDWFLPSKEELNAMYVYKDHIGGFVNSWYWSATEQGDNAWRQRFTNGVQEATPKDTPCRVRPIRRESAAVTPPTVVTLHVTDISSTTAVCGGNVTSDGSAIVTERGICWSTTQNPTVNNHHANNGTGTGEYSVTMTGLHQNTTYYVRAYAVNSQGTAYGEQRIFKTSDGNGGGVTEPEVSTNDVTGITSSTATCGGNVTNNGGDAITDRGVCWSTHQSPTLNDHTVSGGTGTGYFTVNMTGLSEATIYYARAYATNSQGTSYGNEVFFATRPDKPTVTTATVTNITQTTAVGGGNVTATGGAEITERGVCWSVSANPTLSNSHEQCAAGTGSFTVQITGLTANTTYHVRAYARNSEGTSYGNDETFTTQPVQKPAVTTLDVTNITQTTALAGGDVTDDGGANVTERGVCWSTSHNPTGSGSHGHSGSGTGSYTVNMAGLTANTTYYVRAYAKNSAGVSYGAEINFKTALNITAPVVTTSAVTDVTSTSATGGGNVTSDGGANVTERGICWGTSANPNTSGSHQANGTGTGSFTVNMTGLSPGTTYHVRAYAKNSQGTSYGNDVTFTTTANPPTVTTSAVTNVTSTTATGGGNVTSDGGANVTERGVCWGISANPTTSGSHQASGNGTGSFTVNITGLNPGTTYHVRAYAKNSQGTSYGADMTFNTLAVPPSVTTAAVGSVTATSAIGGGNVTDEGGSAVTERGICWGTSANPTISGPHLSNGSGTGSFTVNMTGLSPGTTYHVRAYAKNSQGTSYGNDVTFTTTANPPTVSTSQVTNITQTTATGGGNVTATGGATVTERGICWSTSHDPTTANSHTSGGSGTGAFTANMTGLSPGTTYYVRAYATNSAGTAYGSEISFTTLPATTLPMVVTSAVTGITSNAAVGGGVVTDDGGATVTERGLCWATSANPTTSGAHLASGTGTGSFTVNMTSLSPNTTYHVRAYAKNSQGTSYGEDLTFITLPNLPTLTTDPVTDITDISAIGHGEVTSDGGGTVSEKGICWSTSHNPTVNGAHASNGSGTGNYQVNITGLAESTTYFVRAYATNNAGTAYGNEVSFSTILSGTINGLFSVSATKQVYFSKGNLQYIGSATAPYWKFADHQWDYLGTTTGQNSTNQNVDRDLFGWGTSGYNHGAISYRPWSTSSTNSNYYAYGGLHNNLYDQTGMADWGYNAISNGGNAENSGWRTLTHDEWFYVIHTRSTASGIRYAKAKVNNVNGAILLPDNWNTSYYSLNSTNSHSANYTNNMISSAQWYTLEQHGAVFLPASGRRMETSVEDVCTKGSYWTAENDYSNYTPYYVFCFYFSDDASFGTGSYYRSTGFSVRLVKDYNP